MRRIKHETVAALQPGGLGDRTGAQGDLFTERRAS